MFRAVVWSIVWGTLFVVSYSGAAFATRHFDLSTLVKVGVVLTPIPFFALFLFSEVNMLRQLDEMQKRIQLEALAIAFPCSLLLLMTLGLLQRVIPLPPEDWGYRHVWPLLVIFYFGGIVLARRRYQ